MENISPPESRLNLHRELNIDLLKLKPERSQIDSFWKLPANTQHTIGTSDTKDESNKSTKTTTEAISEQIRQSLRESPSHTPLPNPHFKPNPAPILPDLGWANTPIKPLAQILAGSAVLTRSLLSPVPPLYVEIAREASKSIANRPLNSPIPAGQPYATTAMLTSPRFSYVFAETGGYLGAQLLNHILDDKVFQGVPVSFRSNVIDTAACGLMFVPKVPLPIRLAAMVGAHAGARVWDSYDLQSTPLR